MKDGLFRVEAVEHQQTRWLGSILLMRPISFAGWTALAVTSACMIVALLFWGTYTKKARVSGFLQPDRGIVKVHAREVGTVLEKHVQEGQFVQRGEVLFVLSAERASSQEPEVLASIGRQLETRKASLQNERDQQQRLVRQQEIALNTRIAGIRNETTQLESEMAIQQSRLASLEKQVANYQRLHEQKFLSTLSLQQKQDELLDQQARQQNLARGRLALARDMASVQSELRELPLRAETQTATVERAIAAADQEITEHEARRQIVVRAPQSGVATAMQTNVGQMVPAQFPLLSIVPGDSTLVAHLFAPSSAIGFIEPGHNVLLRYQAFPYQKFGQHAGRVLSISRTALAPNELPFSLPTGAEPLYRIEVSLATQAIRTYGQLQPLQAGMQLEADVVLDTRRLIEWVFEPLYSLTGRA